ncbi:MAG: PIN domain-containing protein [Planctomycetes bacterium]|nr:PIN domain-containing protein [Planctomycetota bacterium]
MKKLRVYADTSVFGGCFDEEFAEASRRFFGEVRAGRFELIVSAIVAIEIVGAPQQVRDLFGELRRDHAQIVEPSAEIGRLRDAYVEKGVVGRSSIRDAEHIAAASVAGADAIVSWNFRDIVNWRRIRGYHGVNLIEGYGALAIHTPAEVVDYEA